MKAKPKGSAMPHWQRNFRHGHAHAGRPSKTYIVWQNMHARCRNPNKECYKNYGGRGIFVCKRWGTFSRFLEDMGEVPLGMTLDRVKNHRGYSPSNCRWATRIEQASNTRSTRLFTYKGEAKSISAWSRVIGITQSCMNRRLSRWPVKRAIEQPVQVLRKVPRGPKVKRL